MTRAYLVETDEVIEHPGSVTKNQFGESEAVFPWEGNWYRIPFFVLEDMLSEMVREKRSGRAELGYFLNQWKYGHWNEVSINVLKSALIKEMQGMEAYKLY